MFKLNNLSFSLAQREYLGIKKFYSYVKFASHRKLFRKRLLDPFGLFRRRRKQLTIKPKAYQFFQQLSRETSLIAAGR